MLIVLGIWKSVQNNKNPIQQMALVNSIEIYMVISDFLDISILCSLGMGWKLKYIEI
jgi:hypothetical protein